MFLESMTDVICSACSHGNTYVDLFLEAASCLKEGKKEEIPYDTLQDLSLIGIFYVHSYFQWIEKQVPEVIDNLYQEKMPRNKQKGKKFLLKKLSYKKMHSSLNAFLRV